MTLKDTGSIVLRQVNQHVLVTGVAAASWACADVFTHTFNKTGHSVDESFK